MALTTTDHRRTLSVAAHIVASIAGLTLVLGTLAGCRDGSGPASSPSTTTRSTAPLVVVTTPILGDLVRQVGGDAITVDVLIPPGADPHDFEPSAAQAARLRDATLVIANGLGLEENLESTLKGARDDGVTVVEIGDRLNPITIDDHDHDAERTSKSDHNHGGDDPHFWLDPERMATAATLVATQLAALPDVDNATVQARAVSYSDSAKAALAEATQLLSVVPAADRKLVTNHDALEYFAQRFNLEVIGTAIPGGSTMAEPSAADIKNLVGVIKRNGVRAIFSESTVSSKIIETVQREVGSQVRVVELSTDTLGPAGSETATYPGLIVTTARLIANGLTGK